MDLLDQFPDAVGELGVLHHTAEVFGVGAIGEDREVKVHFSTKGHHGIVVPVFAYGPHAEDFIGVYENAELSARIRKLMK